MFSLNAFYDILSKNLLKPIGCVSYFFSNFGSTDFNDLKIVDNSDNQKSIRTNFFYDQEPITTKNFVYFYSVPPDNASATWLALNSEHVAGMSGFLFYFTTRLNLFSNSEISKEKDELLQNYQLLDWYYFFHGFAALDWFRNIQYMPPIRNCSKIFITFNNLCTKKRSYRLDLIARLLNENLDNFGYISLSPENLSNNIHQELIDPNCLLSIESKKIIVKQLLPMKTNLTIDTDTPHGALSAFDNLEVLSMGLFHLVTETVYYDDKKHLTEKIFKPIVARRPFILVGAVGNLAYLKSYGFRTFDRWIDESYDNEQDPGLRIIKIVSIIKKLCSMTETELLLMIDEMQQVLDYNFHWFYNGFKQKIVNELVDNFQRCLIKYNAGKDRSFPDYVDYSTINFEDVKHRLGQ